jgi:hypothetical protein
MGSPGGFTLPRERYETPASQPAGLQVLASWYGIKTHDDESPFLQEKDQKVFKLPLTMFSKGGYTIH